MNFNVNGRAKVAREIERGRDRESMSEGEREIAVREGERV